MENWQFFGNPKNELIYIFDSFWVWRMQLILIILIRLERIFKFVIPNLGHIYFCTSKFFTRPFKAIFNYKITFWIWYLCYRVVNIHKGYFVVKNWWEIFFLKLSGIQRILIALTLKDNLKARKFTSYYGITNIFFHQIIYRL